MFLSRERSFELTEKYGSPLYVYDETILRRACREMHDLLPGRAFRVSYSIKANSSPQLLKIIQDEDIDFDAMSPGEIYVLKQAGCPADRIFYVGNNVSEDELRRVAEEHVVISVDSLSQLETFGRLFPGGEVAVRFNPGVGAGHHEKVITGGANTKFGVQRSFVPQVKELLAKYDLKLAGIDQHIGSLFMDPDPYIRGAESLLAIAAEFPGLRFIDMGGGFGVPYHEGEGRLDLKALSARLEEIVGAFLSGYDNKDVVFRVEPGRYIAAECGVLLGRVNSVKENHGTTYVGTDIGFNVLMRPVLYDSYHAVEIIKARDGEAGEEIATVVGNICESGDIIAKDRRITKADTGDLIAVGNAGAYGYSMSSNYNNRLRPAEVLIGLDSRDRLIRRHDSFEDLISNWVR